MPERDLVFLVTLVTLGFHGSVKLLYMYHLAVILVVVSTDYGRKQILFHWITVILRIMNLVSESLKSIFFIEGERALGWCFLHMSALKSS